MYDTIQLKIKLVKFLRGEDMFEKKSKLILSQDDKSILIRALVELKNSLIAEGKYTDAVDEMILKVYHA